MASQSTYVDGPKTFTAGEDLEPHRRVKIDDTGTSSPPEVIYADAGEQAVGITLHGADDLEPVSVVTMTKEGTFFGEAADSFSLGATLYAAADGKISDTSSGTAIGIALEAATAAGDIVEFMPFPVISTTAATVSIADAGTFTSQTTVEAALQEIYQDLISAQAFIPVPIGSLYESDGTNMTALTGSTAPILDMKNGDTDSVIILTWATPNVDAVIFSVALPPDIDTSADVVLHFRAAMESTNDTPTIAADSYFNEGDTKVEDTSAAVTGTSWAEYTITIAAADIPAGAQTLTMELTPGAHGTDALYVNVAMWLEYTRSLRGS